MSGKDTAGERRELGALREVPYMGVIFVVAEAAPKTFALLHPERTALMVAPVVRVLVGSLPVRAVTRVLVFLANVLIPGRGRPAGPAASEEELLALADVAVEAGELAADRLRSYLTLADEVKATAAVDPTARLFARTKEAKRKVPKRQQREPLDD